MTSGFRKGVLLVLLLGVAVIGYHFMIRPANERLSQAKQRLDAKLTKLTDFEQATAKAEDITKQLEQLDEAIKFFDSRLPPTSEIYKVLEQITVIAQKQGLRPKTIRTLKAKDNNGYVEQPLKMELEGNFTSFYSFLLELENLPRIMKIRELTLDKQKQGEGQIAADFIVSIFFQDKTS
jgi:type IV pilus assembly protein PilO